MRTDVFVNPFDVVLVPATGVEPARPESAAPKAAASTNSATRADQGYPMLPSSEYVTADISQEEWREAFKTDADGDVIWLYRINNPATLIFRRGGTTHRVIDRDGIVHLYPMDALLRWKPRDNNDPVQF